MNQELATFVWGFLAGAAVLNTFWWFMIGRQDKILNKALEAREEAINNYRTSSKEYIACLEEQLIKALCDAQLKRNQNESRKSNRT